MRVPDQLLTRQLGQQNLRARRGRAHQLAAVPFHEMVAVVLLQSEARAIGRDRFREGSKRLHFLPRSLTNVANKVHGRRPQRRTSIGVSETPCKPVFEIELVLHA